MDFVLDLDVLNGAFAGYQSEAYSYNANKSYLASVVASKPTPPMIVASSADWNNYTDSLTTWEGSYADALTNYDSSKILLAEYVKYVIQSLGIWQPFPDLVGELYSRETWCIDQWVKVQDTSTPPINYWLGVKSSDYELIITAVEPTGVFPNM